jgi:hypothetical protein
LSARPPATHSPIPQNLRVSVASLCRVTFDHPDEGSPWLAFERRATVHPGPPPQAFVTLVAFGGAAQLRQAQALAAVVPGFSFDSHLSEAEQDFRILIPPAAWPVVRAFCLSHLSDPLHSIIDASPDRELAEEFSEDLNWEIAASHYTAASIGAVIEDTPVPSDNARAAGALTVRVYQIHEVRLLDTQLIQAILDGNNKPDSALVSSAVQSSLGRANAASALPAAHVTAAIHALIPAAQPQPFTVNGHRFDPSASALFPEFSLPGRIFVSHPGHSASSETAASPSLEPRPPSW